LGETSPAGSTSTRCNQSSNRCRQKTVECGGGPRERVSSRCGRVHRTTFVTAEAHPHVRFRRAIERRALWMAEDAARELPNLPLEDALQLVRLYGERGSPKYDRAALRRLERYLAEGSPLSNTSRSQLQNSLGETHRTPGSAARGGPSPRSSVLAARASGRSLPARRHGASSSSSTFTQPRSPGRSRLALRARRSAKRASASN
jgi:hypothetical protein